MNRTVEINPRDEKVGGGWRLRLLEDDEEVGGGVFPDDEYGDAIDQGDEWLAAYAGTVDQEPQTIERNFMNAIDLLCEMPNSAAFGVGLAEAIQAAALSARTAHPQDTEQRAVHFVEHLSAEAAREIWPQMHDASLAARAAHPVEIEKRVVHFLGELAAKLNTINHDLAAEIFSILVNMPAVPVANQSVAL